MATVSDHLAEQGSGATRRAVPWVAIGWFTALLIVAYFPILRRLVIQWSTDEDVGHGFFVPVVAGYIAWQRRDELMALEYKPAWWGILLILWGVLQSMIGSLG